MRTVSPLQLGALLLLTALNISAAVVLFTGRGSESGNLAPSADWQTPKINDTKRPAAKPIEAYPQIVDRPLFTSSRRPFVPVAVMPEVPSRSAPIPAPIMVAPPPNIILTAVAIDGELQRAYLAPATQRDRGDWYAIGATVEGWQLASIEAEAIVLKLGEQQKRIALFDGPSAAPAITQQQPLMPTAQPGPVGMPPNQTNFPFSTPTAKRQ